MLSEVVTCNCVRNPGGHAETNPRPSEEGVSFYHVLRPLDRNMYMYMDTETDLARCIIQLIYAGSMETCDNVGSHASRAHTSDKSDKSAFAILYNCILVKRPHMHSFMTNLCS